MLTEFTNKLGTEQGRIAPTGWTPHEGNFVLCVGSDVAGRIASLQDGASMAVEQTANLGTAALVRFRAHTRGPLFMPQVVEVMAAAAGGYTISVDGNVASYTATVDDTVCTIAAALAAAVNATAAAVSARPIHAGAHVQIDPDDPDADTPTIALSGSLQLATFSWVARCEIDGNPFWSQTVLAGRARERIDGGAMVRVEQQLGADITLGLKLLLSSSIASAPAEVELPAFYVDDVVLSP